MASASCQLASWKFCYATFVVRSGKAVIDLPFNMGGWRAGFSRSDVERNNSRAECGILFDATSTIFQLIDVGTIKHKVRSVIEGRQRRRGIDPKPADGDPGFADRYVCNASSVITASSSGATSSRKHNRPLG